MLTITDLTITRQDNKILEIDCAALSTGQSIAVLGPNGAGKSSLLKVICGEWPAAEGMIQFHGKPLHRWSRQNLARHLGVLPQASKVDFPFSAFEVAAIGATPLTLKKRELTHRVRHFLTVTDALHLADQPYSRLSGGEKQRIQLARVLLQLSQAEQPPLLLLDEPTSAQDLGHQHQLMTLISNICKEQSFGVIAVLHDLNLASRYSDEVWIIDNQHLQISGDPETVLTPDRVQQHWHYRPQKVTNLKQGFGLL